MVTRSRLAVSIVPVMFLAVVSACSSGGTSGYPAASNAPATSAPASSMPASSAPATSSPSESATGSASGGADAATLALTMADSSLGSILVDGKGMTLYLFTKDTQNANASVCSGQCLAAWPPLAGKPTAGSGVDDSKLGSFQRDDGTTQATYNGWPLYYWKNDAKPGDVTGQGVQGVWFVLDKDGNAVKA